MARNLIDLLEQMLGSNEVLSRIGALIGLSPDRVKGAIGAAVPAILASLTSVAQTSRGREQLAGQIRNQDTSMLDNITGALGGGKEQPLIGAGAGMLSTLLGQGKFETLTGAVSKYTGLNQSSTGSLLGALAPVVMGTLAREQRSQGLDAQGLAGLLNDQKDHIAHALPAGLASSLGSAGLLDGIADRLGQGASTAAQAGRATAAEATRAASAVRTTPPGVAPAPASRGSGSIARWVIGALVLLGILWAASHFLFRKEPVPDTADRPATTAPDQPATTTPEVGAAGQNLMVGNVDVGREVKGIFDGATSALNGVTDSASAQAAAPKLREIDGSLTKVRGMVDQLPAQGKSALAALVSAALPTLESLIAKVNAIPGAGDVIKPITDPMLEKLRAMTA